MRRQHNTGIGRLRERSESRLSRSLERDPLMNPSAAAPEAARRLGPGAVADGGMGSPASSPAMAIPCHPAAAGSARRGVVGGSIGMIALAKQPWMRHLPAACCGVMGCQSSELQAGTQTDPAQSPGLAAAPCGTIPARRSASEPRAALPSSSIRLVITANGGRASPFPFQPLSAPDVRRAFPAV